MGERVTDDELLESVSENATPEVNEGRSRFGDVPAVISARNAIAGALPATVRHANKLMELINSQMEEENTMRKDLIDYFKSVLFNLFSIPIIVGFAAYIISDGSIQLEEILKVFLVTIPVEVVGVFYVIASKLFDDPYRKTVPEMLSQVLKDLMNY